ncbi:MAG: EcsC family protein, partial [Burkholderiales bacterium]
GRGARRLTAAPPSRQSTASRRVALPTGDPLQTVPVVGAVTGALVNVAFMQHFDDVARGHFIVRRLERRYGSQAIRAAYYMRVARERALRAREFSPLEGW